MSEEDEQLWTTVAKSVQPAKMKKRVTVGKSTAEAPPRVKNGETAMSPTDASRSAVLPAVTKEASRPRKTLSVPPLAEFDVKQVRRIASGRTRIEARLDLHGLRADEARVALRGFIFGCFASGKRSLLVITGKGDAADDRLRPFELSHSRSRGVLKRSVPAWLAEPELRAVVVSFTVAHARHGGEGALYVQLRSQRRGGRE